MGGVQAGVPLDSRNLVAEQSVRNHVTSSGLYSQLTAGLGPLEAFFDVSGKTGISGALNRLFQSFSAWSTTPGSASAQQTVLSAAQNVAESFRQAASQVSQIRSGTDSDLSATVAQINQLGAKIQRKSGLSVNLVARFR